VEPSELPAVSGKQMSASKLRALDYENIVTRSPGMIDVYDYRSGNYVYVNGAIQHILGYDPADMLKGGLNFFISKIHKDDLEASKTKNEVTSLAVSQYGPGIDDSKPFTSFEYRVRHKDGHWVWLHTDARVFSRLPSGELEYVVNTCVDITEQKAAEAKLRESTKKLKASEKALRVEHDQLIALNIAKDEFVSIASHQLRGPATGVKQYIGLLLQGYAGEVTDAQLTILRAALDSNERQLDIISNLLNTSRLDAGKVQLHKKDNDLVSLAQQVITEQQEKFNARRQKVSFLHGKSPVMVCVDERLTLMVIENLLDNASKYSPEGKSIEISLSTKGSDAILDIKDHGSGIPRADQKKLFQKFSRIENVHTANIAGTGLGLYWAKKVADLHGGDIRLKSSTQKGTVFSVTLPLVKA
jgi:PAS domain S-box-containing protein